MALRGLHLHFGDAPRTVHLDGLVASTGASRFGEELRESGWRYDKREDLSDDAGDFDAFDFRSVYFICPREYQAGGTAFTAIS